MFRYNVLRSEFTFVNTACEKLTVLSAKSDSDPMGLHYIQYVSLSVRPLAVRENAHSSILYVNK